MSKLAALATILLGVIALAAIGTTFYVNGVPQVPLSLFEKPCSTPLAVRIDTIDPKFNISKATVENSLTLAIKIWNDGAGKAVLSYEPNNPKAIPISLIYDTRQATVTLGQSIDSTEADQNSERAAIETLHDNYDAAGKAYNAAADQFASESASYEAEVKDVNAKGGADPDTYARLQAERTRLNDAQTALIAQGAQLKTLGDTLQKRVDSYNASVSQINSVVTSFNAHSSGDFEEGQYARDSSGTRISIYAYKSIGELEHSLTHEMGHALGLGHNSNPDSVMYPFTTPETKLTADDIAALKTACKLD